ncbi:hypothetical protein [Verminephrobacter eiseniae]|uniref:hypothetical protein n=1 Tax=Verminephrobacter eiseniae TaxID=364317 RepID=UPI002238AC16|nr:hypothetical protein [Verminephrobacter eiseniae]MCW5236707.1 hypothetical protein [Verminephrobacter eiseniae]
MPDNPLESPRPIPNSIENMDMGADVLEAILQRACEPISNEEFTRREKALWLQRHQLVTGAAA